MSYNSLILRLELNCSKQNFGDVASAVAMRSGIFLRLMSSVPEKKCPFATLLPMLLIPRNHEW